MQAVPELNIDFYSDEVITAPHQHYAQMRALAPVVYLPAHDNYALTRHAHIKAALKDHQRFSSAQGVAGDSFGCEFLQGNTVASDPPRHTQLRRAMAQPLFPVQLEQIKPRIEEEAGSLIARLIKREQFDTPTDLSAHLPLTIVRDLVGLPDHGQEKMLAWAGAAFDVLGCQNTRGKKGLETIKEMRRFISTELKRDVVKPGSWTARLLDLVDAGELEAELAPFAIRDYINPSLDTTISATSELIYQLAKNPDTWFKIKANPEHCKAAVNEAVRLATPIRSFTRTTLEPITVDEYEIPAGKRVMMLFASANRDETVFENPNQFDIRRPAHLHLGFGSGIHRCVGMNLAQLEMTALLQAMIRSVTLIECETPVLGMNNTIHAIRSMPTRLIADN